MVHSLDAIVKNGLCIGCGLCASLAGHDRVEMRWTPEGRLRPEMDGAFPLREAAAAHARMEAGEHIGKIVLAVEGQ